MDNYQILGVLLDAAFFATVAAIAVIFVLVRERSMQKAATDRAARRSLRFSNVLNQAVGRISESGGRFDDSRTPAAIMPDSASGKRARIARQENTKKELSRAERELIANMAAGK